MKKLFNNSTKSKDIDIEQTEVQTSSKSKRKALRGFAFGGVALMMATAGVFAFAPLGTVQPASLEASQPTDVLVTPKEDDPVLFTTEDGLEIKWGNAASLQGGGKETWSASKYTTQASAKAQYSATPTDTYTSNLTSGNLNGFPYFTTKSGSTTLSRLRQTYSLQTGGWRSPGATRMNLSLPASMKGVCRKASWGIRSSRIRSAHRLGLSRTK